MKKLAYFILSIFFVICITGIAGFFWWKSSTTAPSNDSTPKRIVITRGASGEKIGQILKEAGVIKNTFAFKAYLQMNNLTRKLPTGEFSIPPNLDLAQVVKKLLAGPTQVWVTVPEGKRREEVANIIASGLELKGEAAVQFKNDFLVQSADLEGFLFPDTYLFPKEATASAVVNRMKSTFDQRFTGTMKSDLSSTGLSLLEAVTLASILERETVTDEERPIVAGILLNRLEADWPLQADATVQYAKSTAACRQSSSECEWWPKSLTRVDLDMSSSFNTYKNTGLPPHPIANPGFSSLKAVVYSQDSPYWFYIHDPEGKIHYGQTLEEHNANIAKYLSK